jgi:hypothetical protein
VFTHGEKRLLFIIGCLHSGGQDRLKDPEEAYQQASKGKGNTLGYEHTSTLATVNNLGVLHEDQGKLKEVGDRGTSYPMQKPMASVQSKVPYMNCSIQAIVLSVTITGEVCPWYLYQRVFNL